MNPIHIFYKNVKILIRKISILCFITVVTIVFSACSILPKEEDVLAPPIVEAPKIVYDELEVKKSNIQIVINDNATFQSSNLENDFFKYNVGYLKNINVKVGDKVKAGDLLGQLETEDLLTDLEKKQITLQMDQLTYDKIKNQINDATDNKAKSDLNNQLQQQSLKLKLDNLDISGVQKQINRSKLISSISGQVIFVDEINPGDRITTYKTVVTIADPSRLNLQYSGDKMDKFDLGVAVKVKVDGKDYTGKVVMNPRNYPADTSEDKKKVVIIKLDSIPSIATIGTTADISLLLQSKDNVIVLPRGAIHNFEGRNYVEMLDKGLRTERNVELGIQNATSVEIIKGLSEGEKILQ